MSQRKKNARLSQSSYSSPAQPNELQALLASGDYEISVSHIIQFMLIAEQKKTPIKRGDLTKFVFPGQKYNGKVCNAVLKLAKLRLEDVFGLSFEAVGNGHFVVFNKLDNNYPQAEEVTAEHCLIVLVLCKIFLAGDVIKEGELLSLIEKMGFTGPAVLAKKLDKSGLADGKKLLKDLARQGYVNSSVIELNDGEVTYVEYTWGTRAVKEFTKMQMVELASKWYQLQPREFGELYKKALQDDNEEDDFDDDEEDGHD